MTDLVYEQRLRQEQELEAAPAPVVEPEPKPKGATAGGKKAAEMDAEERASRLAQVVTVRCVDCVWEDTGRQDVVRPAFAVHRRDAHGDRGAVRRIERALARVGVVRRSPSGGRGAAWRGKKGRRS